MLQWHTWPLSLQRVFLEAQAKSELTAIAFLWHWGRNEETPAWILGRQERKDSTCKSEFISYQGACSWFRDTHMLAVWWKESRNSSGPSFVIPHFAGMFGSRWECKARTGQALLNPEHWQWLSLAQNPKRIFTIEKFNFQQLPNFLWVYQR